MESGYYQPQTSENKPSEVRTGSSQNHTKNFLDFVMRVRRRARRVPLVLTLIILTSFFQAGQSVWSLNIPHQVYIVGFVNQFCDGMGLTAKQSELCARNREAMVGVRYGANLATKQCQFQFQYRRWNCSVPQRDANTLFRRITGKGTREAAFTYAISSAGVVYSLARQCSESNLSGCGCSRERRPKEIDKMAREQGRDENNNPVEFQWGGCGDNIAYGTEFAKNFFSAGEDNLEETRDQEKTLMNVHNNEVGIQVVKKSSVINCKCHGVTESCSLRTCWRELVQFSEIGKLLLDKYDSATKVRYERRTGRIVKKSKSAAYSRKNGKRRSTSNKPTTNDLVYISSSPDYCVRNNKRQTLGTVGRECKIDSDGPDGCRKLCCNRGFLPTEEVTVEKCRCKFRWCCYVKCDECVKTRTKYICH